MSTLTIGHVSVTLLDGTSEFVGKPSLDADETTGSAQCAIMRTPDGLDMTMGVITWPDGQVDVRMVDQDGGPEPYSRLQKAGTMNLKVTDGTWVLRIRAMKVNGRDWPTLNRVNWGELDWLAQGANVKALLAEFGASATGLYGDLAPTAGPSQRNDIALTCPAGNLKVVATIYALTRVEAIMQQLGVNGPKGIDA